ncbi:putative RNA polymerase sigma factor [Labilithrix luteola]|uniref:Putative RNA polymerase sigma factor n=1 Tax=Labilithrix luteola TaxID=1391654 RepID=A0A0K1PJ87_9BACT|nr:RNA polymerase sigma factor SigJ [Labilithrix luteola]AKU93585.1 putative RNA polymerase sigma factor [Labilithrix luteola]
MNEQDWLAARFEEHRSHLRGVAFRMLGSTAEADEAVQNTWLRLSRSDADGVENIRAWLTTVIARVCLNVLESRRTRREEPLDCHVPDPIVGLDGEADPEQEALLADSVGLALQVVLDALPPSERLAFVLHDMFDLTFDEIAPMLGRSPAAARQLASRARRRVRGAPSHATEPSGERHRAIVDAFFAAAKGGNLEALIAVLDPDVVLRADGGHARREVSIVLQGADAIAQRAFTFVKMATTVRPALVNGTAGAVVLGKDGPISVMGFTVNDGKISEIDTLADPERLARLDLSAFKA